MNKKRLIEYLSDDRIPDDAEMCISAIMAHNFEDEEDDPYTIILDNPIHGMAYSEEHNEFRFVIEKSKDYDKEPLGEILTEDMTDER